MVRGLVWEVVGAEAMARALPSAVVRDVGSGERIRSDSGGTVGNAQEV